MTEAAEIHHEREARQGRYFADIEGSERQAELTWNECGGVRHATHTFVPPALRGRGIAARLVEAMIADAREQGFRIAPDCSYVRSYFDDRPELAELRA